MSYIAPDSTIHILHNVPLHKSYENTAYFATPQLQRDYFLTKLKKTYNDYSYLRKERVLRVEGLCDYFYDCNYLMFQNTAFGNKWFYAFIDDVRYINNNTTEIVFTIDVMQTWFFDYTMEECYVEREHTESDELFEHLETEDFSNLETLTYNRLRVFPTAFHFEGNGVVNGNDEVAVLIVSNDLEYNEEEDAYENLEEAFVSIQNGVLCGTKFLVYDIFNEDPTIKANEIKGLRNALGWYTVNNKVDAIYGLYQMPRGVINITDDMYFKTIQSLASVPSTFGNYTPKNNKLFNAPFNYLTLSTYNNDKVVDLKYEYFENGNVELCAVGVGGITPTYRVFPKNYKDGKVVSEFNGQVVNISPSYGVEMTFGNPCTYTTDSYLAWMAQNSGEFIYSAVDSGVTGVLGYAEFAGSLGTAIATQGRNASISNMAGGLRAFSQSMFSIAKLGAKAEVERKRGAAVSGSAGTMTFDHATETVGCYIEQLQIREDTAKIIDSFLTLYGYVCGKVKVPNRNARPFFTYTKTVGCQIHGSIPQDDTIMIEEIFDNGVRFWNNPELIGQYSELDNSPDRQ